jgi:hypothetical protein
MKQIVSTRNIGTLTVSIDEDGTLQIQSPALREALTFEPSQAQELFQWLNEQRNVFARPAQAAPVAPAPAESPEEATRRVITESIVQAQANYPTSLAPENRDRFIEQIARNPTVKPLMSKGQISRKQLMLWIDQQLSRK